MSKNEKNNVNVQAETVFETMLATVETAIDSTVHAVEPVDAQEKELREAIQKMMASRGLVSCNVPILAMETEAGWREELRRRFVAIVNCHKPGSTVRVKIDDLIIDEEKTVKNGNRKTVVKVSRHDAIGKTVAGWMADSKDKSERLETGKVKITEAKDPVLFTVKTPTVKKPFLEICFDMNK